MIDGAIVFAERALSRGALACGIEPAVAGARQTIRSRFSGAGSRRPTGGAESE